MAAYQLNARATQDRESTEAFGAPNSPHDFLLYDYDAAQTVTTGEAKCTTIRPRGSEGANKRSSASIILPC